MFKFTETFYLFDFIYILWRFMSPQFLDQPLLRTKNLTTHPKQWQ